MKTLPFTEIVLLSLLLLISISCNDNEFPERKILHEIGDTLVYSFAPQYEKLTLERGGASILVDRDVSVKDMFALFDSLSGIYPLSDTLIPFEYYVVHANPWIINKLWQTDYYYLMEKGWFVDNPQSIVIIEKGDELIIPDFTMEQQIRALLQSVELDLNIPEFKLRILQNGKELYHFPVRVGKNKEQYLEMAGREVNLRTIPGEGEIIRVEKNPQFINPVDNKPYAVTRRDDGRVTKLPNIPWLEAELDGQLYGQLIHPTTNINTLGKPSSNGCVGLREGDAWVVCFYAPVGTKVTFRYELEIKNPSGEVMVLADIYKE